MEYYSEEGICHRETHRVGMTSPKFLSQLCHWPQYVTRAVIRRRGGERTKRREGEGGGGVGRGKKWELWRCGGGGRREGVKKEERRGTEGGEGGEGGGGREEKEGKGGREGKEGGGRDKGVGTQKGDGREVGRGRGLLPGSAAAATATESKSTQHNF